MRLGSGDKWKIVTVPGSLHQFGTTYTWTANDQNGLGSGPTYKWEYMNTSCGGGLEGFGNSESENLPTTESGGGALVIPPGGDAPLADECNVWKVVGSSKTYSRQVNNTSFRLRATVTRGTETVSKTLYLSTPGGGGGGAVSEPGPNLAALGGLPRAYALHGAAPNPIRAGTPATVRFDLPEATDVHLAVYDTRGRAVQTLVSGRVEGGRHRAPFDLTGLADGVYVVHLTAGTFDATRSVTVLR